MQQQQLKQPNMTDQNEAPLQLIVCQGADSRDFLHRQLCSDVLNLQGLESSLTGFCTPQGRLLANGFLHCVNEQEFILAIHHSVAKPLQEQLKRYLFRAKVSLELDDLRFSLLISEQSTATDSKEKAVNPAAKLRFLCNAAKTDETAAQSAYALNQAERLQLGMPLIQSATSEKFLPQMLNLDQLGGLSFTKGCYPGQEVVARTHHLGKLKQRVFLFRTAPGDDAVPLLPAVGSRLYTATDTEAQPVGTVLEVVSQERDGRHSLLIAAIVRIGYEQTNLSLLPDAGDDSKTKNLLLSIEKP